MKRPVLVLMAVCMTAAVGAMSLEATLSGLLPPEVVKPLLADGVVERISYRERGAILQLAPRTELGHQATLFDGGEPPTFFVETLHLHPKKNNELGKTSDVPRISRILRSLSRLEGLEYFSASRNRNRLLYEKAYVISDPRSKTRIPDPVAGSAEGMTLFVLLKDLTFGEGIYRYEFRQTENSVAFFSKNHSAMSFGILRIIDPERLRIALVVEDLGTHLLIYALTRADIPGLPGLENRVRASFTTRAQALYRWFLHEYESQ